MVRVLTGLLAALLGFLGSVVGVVGGYYFGVVRSRNDRRDNAIADIYKGLVRFYRALKWRAEHPRAGSVPTPDGEEALALAYVEQLYAEFTDAYYGNSIWLGQDTDERIGEFAVAARSLLDRFRFMDGSGRVPDASGPQLNARKKATEELDAKLAPLQREIRGRLRSEMEASLYLIPYRVVFKQNPRPER